MPSSVRFGSRPSERDDALVFVRLEAVAFENRGGIDHARCMTPASPKRSSRCRFEHDEAVGAAERRLARALRMRHQPDDVARSLQMPAIASTEPFGFAASVTSPSGVV